MSCINFKVLIFSLRAGLSSLRNWLNTHLSTNWNVMPCIWIFRVLKEIVEMYCSPFPHRSLYLCSLFCTFTKTVAHHSCFSSENSAFHATFMKTIANHSCFSSENSALESSFMSNNLLKLRLPGRLESCKKIKIKN